jgi:hypothetical protein
MLEKSKCCKRPYRLRWTHDRLRCYAICSFCGKKIKDLGFFIIYDDYLIREILNEKLN